MTLSIHSKLLPKSSVTVDWKYINILFLRRVNYTSCGLVKVESLGRSADAYFDGH